MAGQTEAKIVVTAQTDGATQKLTETARATEGMKTAAEAAGAAQAGLAAAISKAKGALDSSAAATQRAKQAEEILAATIRKHGAESDAAKAATERHARAVKEASQAAAEAKQAQEQMRLALAKANVESDKASPALARMTKQVQDLDKAAQKAAHDIAKLELSSVGQGADKAAGGLNLLGMAGGKLASMLGPAALGGAVVAFAGWIGEAAQATLQYETALANIPFAIENAQAATGGLVDKFSLAKSAAQAVSLGIVKTEKDFNTLAEAATKIALRLGTDATQAISDMTTALGRGSPLILDNLGVIVKVSEAQEKYAASIGKSVSALTEEEKTLAFREAAMKALLKSANETKVGFDGNAAAILRAKTNLSDLWSTIKDGTVNAVGAAIAPVYAYTDALERQAKFAKDLAEAGGPMELLEQRMISYAVETGGATNATLEFIAAQTMTAEQLARIEAAQDSERRKSLAQRAATEQNAALQARNREIAEQKDAAARRDAFWRERSAKEGEEARKEAERKRGKGKKDDAAFMDPDSVRIARTFDGREATDQVSSALVARQDATAQAAFEAEVKRREETIANLSLEMEARQAAGEQTADLYQQQMALELELLRFTQSASKDRAAIERAETRYSKAQHQQRLRDLAATYAAEQKEREQREARVQKMAGAVESFSSAMVGAMQAEAEGSKYAVALSLESWLKGVRNQMIVTALKETALGIGAAASYNYPAAAAHFSAAGAAGFAAAAAGTGALVTRGVTEAVSGKSWDAIKGGGASGSGGTSAAGMARESQDKETARRNETSKQGGAPQRETPVSWEHWRRNDATSGNTPRMQETQAPLNVTVQVTGLVAGDERELGARIAKLVRQGEKLGRRV